MTATKDAMSELTDAECDALIQRLGIRDIEHADRRRRLIRAGAAWQAARAAPAQPVGDPIGHVSAPSGNLSYKHLVRSREPRDNEVGMLLYAAHPSAPAQPVARPSDDELWDKTLKERDDLHEMADALADAISKHFGVEIGEHSSANSPWQNALDAIAEKKTQENYCAFNGCEAEPVDGGIYCSAHAAPASQERAQEPPIVRPCPPELRAMAEEIANHVETRTEEEIIADGVKFIMGPGGDEGTRKRVDAAPPADDLVTRLRRKHDMDCELHGDPCDHTLACTCSWIERREAADEITQLRNEVDMLRDTEAAEITQLRAKVERLERERDESHTDDNGTVWTRPYRMGLLRDG